MLGILAKFFRRTEQKEVTKDLSLAQQKRLGVPKPAEFEKVHSEFLREVFSLLDNGTIDTKFPMTFIHEDVYSGLSQDWKAKVDMATPNIVSLLERIMDLHARPENDASVEMKNLIETLWQAKERIERQADVFIF